MHTITTRLQIHTSSSTTKNESTKKDGWYVRPDHSNNVHSKYVCVYTIIFIANNWDMNIKM